MSGVADPWSLPSLASFLDELEASLERGLAIMETNVRAPPGGAAAMAARMRARDWVVMDVAGGSGSDPAVTFGQALGIDPTLDALLVDHLHEYVALVNGSALEPCDVRTWKVFLKRFLTRRDLMPTGVSIFLHAAPGGLSDGLPAVHWRDRPRRVDVHVWADLHSPVERDEALGQLASSLAVEVCVWRLDLAAQLAQASTDDLFDPVGWLARRTVAPMPDAGATKREACPLELLAKGDMAELQRRIWRAQLSAIFAWLEDRRQELIDRYRRYLRVTDHLRELGVERLDEMELGAVAWQLRSKIDDRAYQHIRVLSRIRNDIAHRTPASPTDLDRAFRGR